MPGFNYLTPEDEEYIKKIQFWKGPDAASREKQRLLSERENDEAGKAIGSLDDEIPSLQEPQEKEPAPIDLSGLDVDTRFGMPSEKEPTAITMPEEIPEAPAPMSLQQKREMFASKGLYSNPKVQDFLGVQQGQQTRQGLEGYASGMEEDEKGKREIISLIDAGRYEDAIDMIKTKQAGLTGGRGLGVYQMEMATQEDRDRANQTINEIEKSGKTTPEITSRYRNWAERDPIGFNREMGRKSIGTEEMLRGKEESIPLDVDKAGRMAAARNLAPDKLSQKDRDSLLGAQQIFTNLDNAYNQFEEDWATRYAGKQMKLSWLRQNDEDFAQFMTNTGLGMNEYRRQNFGTAQTNSEIQNFLDVLNSDLSVSPEVLKKQFNTLLNAMDRDYVRKVTTIKGSNYVVPKSLETSNPSNTRQPEQTPKPEGATDKIEQLKEMARQGDQTAIDYLKKKGIQF